MVSVLQPLVRDDDFPPLTGQSRINLFQVIAGIRFTLAKEHKIKTARNRLLFSSEITERQV